MTQRSRPWSISGIGDSGPYSDRNWQELLQYMSGGKLHNKSCIIPDSGTPGEFSLYVNPATPASRNVVVSPGAAVVDGVFYLSDSSETLSVPTNSSSSTRYYIVSIKLNRTSGSEGARLSIDLESNTNDTTNILYFPLARITAAPSFTSITAAQIEPRGIYLGGYNLSLTVLRNISGSAIGPGRAVRIDTSQAKSMRVATSNTNMFGISVGHTPNSEFGVVCTEGVVPVYVTNSTSPGNKLIPSSTGIQSTTANTGYIAIALESSVANRYIRAYVKTLVSAITVSTVSVAREA